MPHKLSPDQKKLVKKYGHLFTGTGGNDIVELIEREGVNHFNNPIVALMQGCCASQLSLIESLIEQGIIISDEDRGVLKMYHSGTL